LSLEQFLCNIRLDLRLQAKEVAALVGISQCSIANWENDWKHPTRGLLARLCHFYIKQNHPEAQQLHRA